MEWLLIPMGVFFLVVLVWIERSSAKAIAKEDMQFAKEIEHLPVEKQAEMWLSKIRHDAERDLH